MTNIKGMLYLALGMLGLVIIQLWYQQHPTITPQPATSHAAVHKEALDIVDPSRLVSMENDYLKVDIDPVGAKIVQTAIKGYFKTIKKVNLVTLLSQGKDYQYYALSGYQGDEALVFSIDHADKHEIVLSATKNNIKYIKQFTFSETPYTVIQSNTVENNSFDPIKLRPYIAFLSMHESDEALPAKSFHPGEIQPATGGWFSIPTYSGASYYTESKPYTKLPYTKIETGTSPVKITGGWFALQQRYFLNAWVPSPSSTNTLQTHWQNDVGDDLRKMILQMIGPEILVDADKQVQTQQTLYSGPELENVLHQIAPGLDLTIDYGWLWLLSHWLFWIMDKIDLIVHNWGISIILVTALIKLVFYKMSEKAFVSGLRMKKIQPRIQQIQEQFKDDPASKNKAILELYQKEKINPVGGCLPLLIQFPFLIALYWVLIESVQLRQAAFLWIPDLSSYDPFYILPVILGLGMYFQQKMTPTALDPAQEQAMMVVPFLMTFLFSRFPAGLALYMLTNAFLTALQQWYLARKYK